MRKYRRKAIHRRPMYKRDILNILIINNIALPLRFRRTHRLKRNITSNGNSTTNLNKLISKVTNTTTIKGHRITNSRIRRHMVKLRDTQTVLRRPVRRPSRPRNIPAAPRCTNHNSRQPQLQRLLSSSINSPLAITPQSSQTSEFNPRHLGSLGLPHQTPTKLRS